MRKKTVAEFEAWCAAPGSWSELIQRVAEGEGIREICAAKKLPYSLVAKHIAAHPEVKAEYDAALSIWGDALAQESLGVADGVEGTDDSAAVAAAKLRVETRLKLAGMWDRERYGERDSGRVAVTINLGDAAREIRELEMRLGIVEKPAEALPSPKEVPVIAEII